MKLFLLPLTFLIVCTTAFGQYTNTDTLSYYSDYFKAKRQLKISLPTEYQQYPNRRYKVVYLFDAQSSSLYEFTKATMAYFPGYASFYFDPVILVGIVTKNRHFEFLPKQQNTIAGNGNYPAAGGADTLALSIEKELKPFIESKFRTTGFSIGIGHSLGGTFVTYSMLKFPNIFNAGIAISPNYVYDNEEILNVFKKADTKKNLSGKFLYVAHGNADELEEKFKPSTVKLHELLASAKIPGFYYKVENLDNNNSHSTTPLEGFFKGLVFINDLLNLPYDKYKAFFNNNTDKYIGFLKEYFTTQSKLTGTTLPSIGEFNLIAYNTFYAGKKSEALQILEWAISVYPNDANLFDSMGEIQESAGNKERAKHFYSKGLALTEEQKNELPESIYTDRVKAFNKRLSHLGEK
jgi:predicted alpha/beta superfamily hydrolase